MKVALDLEEVLADTISEACRSTDNLEPEDFHDWDISGYTWQVYAGVSDALWRHDPLAIPPVEPDLHEYVGEIHERADQLDIVTARLHVDDSIRLWLQHYDIPYDNLVSTRVPKYELEDYNIWIDDNPEMFGECRLLLRNHPHNTHLDADSSKSCDRIYSLHEAADFV